MAMIRQYYEDFQEVEYIENTSNAYIDTLYKPNNKTRVETKVYCTQAPTEQPYPIFGGRTNEVKDTFVMWLFSDRIRSDFYQSQYVYIPITESFGTIFTIDKNKNIVTVNDTTVTNVNGNFSALYNMKIFTEGQKIEDIRYFIGRVYYFKIYDDGVLVRDFVPVRQKSSNKFGLWDRVEGKFYISPNGTDFVGGADVVRDSNDNLYYIKDYIQARGYYSYADTEINGNSTDMLKISLMVTSRPSTGWCWLIGYQNSESDRFGIYNRGSSSGYVWRVDFWRGSNTSNRRASDDYAYTGRRYDLVLGNPSTTQNNLSYMIDTRSNTEILPLDDINPRSSSATYIVSENRGGKANYYVRFYNLEIYKQRSGKKVLVLHWIPSQRCSDGVWGFFDLVSKTFHPSEGTEQFTGA